MDQPPVIEAELVPYKETRIAKRSIFDLEPKQQVEKATEMANALYDVIEKQKLYSLIQGKKYVKVEGWELLGTFLGILPRERSIIALEDGSYEASVDLIRASDGVIVGGASAICGIDEKRWASAEKYARRSMAFTRAVGKAYRSSFSWIVSLAGYEVTPAEEIPREDQKPTVKAGSTKNVQQTSEEVHLYSGETKQQETFKAHLQTHGIGEEHWQQIHDAMLNQPKYKLDSVLAGLGLKKKGAIDHAAKI